MAIEERGDRRVAVFGGSRVKEGTDEYAAALRLGRALAEHGFTIVTGGYDGVMAAVSRGAKEAGGQTVGVTVDILAQTSSPNPWIDQEIRTAALLQRIDTLIEMGAGYVVLPGGGGTLAELAVVWNLAFLGALHKPIVVVGEGWRKVFQTMVDELHTVDNDLRFLTFAPDPEAAADSLAAQIAQPEDSRRTRAEQWVRRTG